MSSLYLLLTSALRGSGTGPQALPAATPALCGQTVESCQGRSGPQTQLDARAA